MGKKEESRHQQNELQVEMRPPPSRTAVTAAATREHTTQSAPRSHPPRDASAKGVLPQHASHWQHVPAGLRFVLSRLSEEAKR